MPRPIQPRHFDPLPEGATPGDRADYELRILLDRLRIEHGLSDGRLAGLAFVEPSTITNYFKPRWNRTEAAFYRVLNALQPTPEQRRRAIELYLATRGPADADADADARLPARSASTPGP